MVRIPRQYHPAPAELVKYRDRWLARWQRVCEKEKSDWCTKTARRVLAASLRRMTHGKCAFCEGSLDKDTPTEVEHYTAKTVNHALVFDWTNLLPVCRLCNLTKRDIDHRGLLLKPDEEDPEPYFWLGPEGQLQPHPSLDNDDPRRQRALRTIEICGLQRKGLVVNRAFVAALVKEAMSRRRMLRLLLRPEREHKFVVRHILESSGRQHDAARDRRSFEAPSRD